MRYRLRTLLIVLALGPPLLAWGWQSAPAEWAFWRKPMILNRLSRQDLLIERTAGPLTRTCRLPPGFWEDETPSCPEEEISIDLGNVRPQD